jgi:hypothetical protein
LVDALASGASGLTAVKVRVLSWAPFPVQAVEIPVLQAISAAGRFDREQ